MDFGNPNVNLPLGHPFINVYDPISMQASHVVVWSSTSFDSNNAFFGMFLYYPGPGLEIKGKLHLFRFGRFVEANNI